MRSRDYTAGVHFYLDDYRFERIWRQFERYIPILKRFNCVFTPDFSLFMDMPLAMKIWNIYRSRLIGQMMQKAGIKVIPTVSWAEPATYTFCFDGIESGGVVTVSSIGTFQSVESRKIFLNGLKVMIRRIKPSAIIFYGETPDMDFGKIKTINFQPTTWHWKSRNQDINYQENNDGR